MKRVWLTFAVLALPLPAFAQLPLASDPAVRKEQQLQAAWSLCQPHANMRSGSNQQAGWEAGWEKLCEETLAELRKVAEAKRAAQAEKDKANALELLKGAKE